MECALQFREFSQELCFSVHLSDEVRAGKVFKDFFCDFHLYVFKKSHIVECVVALSYAVAQQQLPDENLKLVFRHLKRKIPSSPKASMHY